MDAIFIICVLIVGTGIFSVVANRAERRHYERTVMDQDFNRAKSHE